MTKTFYEKLKNGCLCLSLRLTDVVIERLSKFYELLIQKNYVMNLTTITDESEVIIKHFIDSLSIVKIPRIRGLLSGKVRAIDVGTGAGFPGMVLKIVFPDLDMILADSVGKKLVFLDEVIDELELDDVKTIHGRAETLGHDDSLREKFDLVTARAVAYLPVLTEYCLPFLKPGGKFVAYKSADCKDEIASSHDALIALGGEIAEDESFVLPETNIKRRIIAVEKIFPTPASFPRRVGIPRKKPL